MRIEPEPTQKEDWEDAIDLAGEIQELLDELPERAEEFRDSVEQKVSDISISIVKARHVTEGQFQALRNMEKGVRKWLQ